MTPLQTMTDFPVFSDKGTKSQPSEAKYAAGFANADVLPYEWVNWLFNKSSSAITTLNGGMTSVQNEIISVLSAAGITPAEATNNQVLAAIQYLIQSKTGILANLSTTDKTTLVAAINEIKASLGSAAGKTAGSAVGNVPVVGTALGTTNNNIVVTDASGKLKPSGTTLGSAAGKTAGSAVGNVPLVGTALGTTNNNIVVTDASGKLKPSGTTIGSAAGKTAGSAVGNVPLVGTALGTTDNNVVVTNAGGSLKTAGITYGNMMSASNAGALCSTAKGTQAKTVTLTGFTLYSGVTVKVMFTNGNSASAPTLNVNNTGAKAIKVVRAGEKIVPVNHTGYWRGASTTSSEMWQPYTILEMMYDGTDWVIVGNPTVESYYSSTSSYEVKADGLIEQWGEVSISSYTATITFPVKMPTRLHLILTPNDATEHSDSRYGYYDDTENGFKAKSYGSKGKWYCVGY